MTFRTMPRFARSAVLAWLLTSAGLLGAADPVVTAREVAAAWPEEVRQALGFEGVEFWQGGEFVSEPKKSGAGAIRWHRHTKNGNLRCLRPPRDLSAFNMMSLWVHSSHANDATFMIVIESEREQGVFSYYSRKVTVDWTGWKQLKLHFRSFGRVRSPAGWDQISAIRFSASGWNQRFSDESVWVFDELEFLFDPTPFRPAVRGRKYVAEPPIEQFAARLRPDHPRLILLDEDLPRIKEFVTSSPLGASWYEQTERTAEQLLRRPVRKHELPDGRRLLSVSRDVVRRIYNWGFMYRMEGDRKWLDRAWQELEAVVNFPDWNPAHYLDTAEMMHAVGIGYDWFYKDFTEEQRRVLREGLWQHGLRLSYAAYLGLEAEGQQGWRQAGNNWNFVCNGGTSLAAMAVFEEMPEKCAAILGAAFQFIQPPIEHFEPDGAWWEGVGYWGYSMRYLLAYLRGLETAFGTDFGFIAALQNQGFALAGDFPIYLSSPANGIFNFADSGSGSGQYRHWAFFYLAARFNNPLYLHFQQQGARGEAKDILYYEPFDGDVAVQDVALDKHFRNTEVATLRSSWTDGNALFAGIKCGRNGVAHAHQDLGSFVFYGLGEKWMLDLGAERQTYLTHQHRLPRHHFYRIREEGHNTLVFDPSEGYSQDRKGEASIVRFESSPRDVFAIADLTDAYREHAVSVQRGYRLFDHRRAFLVQDEIQGKKDAELWWFGHTDKDMALLLDESGRRAVLKRNGKTCHVHLLAPAEGVFQIMDAAPLPTSPNPDIQNRNTNMRKLAVHFPSVRDVTIAVLFVPVYDFEPEPSVTTAIASLASWRLADAVGPTCAGIHVDGEPLAGFSPAVFSYSVELPEDTTRVPDVVMDLPPDAGVGRVELPSSFPGTATCTISRGAEQTVYVIRFMSLLPSSAGGQAHVTSKPVTFRGITVSASHDDGNVPRNVLDGNSDTRWSASGEEEWIAFDFGQARRLDKVAIGWFQGDTRQTRFKIAVSDDGHAWRDVFAGQSSGESASPESYTLPQPVSARHLKITCYGNTSNLWNSITEVRFQ